MRIVIFGLTISSAWANGHATLWRGLCRALGSRHDVTFFEHDVPYYASHRDLVDPPGCALHLYGAWEAVLPAAERAVREADVAMVTSYCPDGPAAAALVLSACPGVRVFYDLDTPVTLERLRQGERVPYLPDDGLAAFDLVLSYTGGGALDELRSRLGARAVAPLYGSVDPAVHRPVPPDPRLRADLSYLGTWAADRQGQLDALFLEPARRLPDRRFLIGGSQYPDDFPWGGNVFYVRHMPPPDHPAFYASSALTLNVTRGAMAAMGYCPSGRLFEAAACGAPILSDRWAGLEQFFEPGREILLADTTDEAMEAIGRPTRELADVARRARAHALDAHTADVRARDFEAILEHGPARVGGRAG